MMIDKFKIVLVSFSLIVSFVDCAVLDRSRIDVNGNNGLNVLGSTQNSESPSQLPMINKNTSTDDRKEDEKPAEDLNNLASIIIGEIMKGILKSTENITVESFNSDEDEKLNSEEILTFEPEISNNEEIEEISVVDESDEEINISDKDIERDDNSKEEEDKQESTENSNNLTTLIISHILDEFSKPRNPRNAPNDENETLTNDDVFDDDDEDENKTEEEVETEENSELKSLLKTLDDVESSQKDDEIVSKTLKIKGFSRKGGSQVATESLSDDEVIEETEEVFANNNEEGIEEDIKETVSISNEVDDVEWLDNDESETSA